MEINEISNTHLGINLHYFKSSIKNERVFIASEIMKKLGFKGSISTLKIQELQENIDYKKLIKSKNVEIFKQLSSLNLLGRRAGTLVFLYESGVWKLIIRSRKLIGINTRNWLAREVLPSIQSKGSYSIAESELNPLSYLYGFTEIKKQKQNSKSVNSLIYESGGNFSEYHNAVHKLVNGMTAHEIQTMFNSKESARQILREHIPENACTIALIDELFTKYNKTLYEISKTGIQNSAKETFKALFELGIKLID